MKKVIVLLAVLALSVTAFAGPMIGIQVAPAKKAVASLAVGWDFSYALVEGTKSDFSNWYGTWTIAGLWTPSANGFGYRLGPKIIWKWNKASGSLTYSGLSLVVGATKTWGAFQIAGELDIGSSGVLSIKPIIGFNILFDGFFPEKTQTP